jgi:hypothetical protein
MRFNAYQFNIPLQLTKNFLNKHRSRYQTRDIANDIARRFVSDYYFFLAARITNYLQVSGATSNAS